jgi:hypothetical protein
MIRSCSGTTILVEKDSTQRRWRAGGLGDTCGQAPHAQAVLVSWAADGERAEGLQQRGACTRLRWRARASAADRARIDSPRRARAELAMVGNSGVGNRLMTASAIGRVGAEHSGVGNGGASLPDGGSNKKALDEALKRPNAQPLVSSRVGRRVDPVS